MLKIVIPKNALWDPFKEEFINIEETTLRLEHSLLAEAKWESEYQKSFFDENSHTVKEITDYIKCMVISNEDDEINENIFLGINESILKQILEYMNKPMTAATFKDRNRHSNRRGEKTTSETVYWMMSELGIPYRPCETWHINRLFALIHFCQIKQTPGKKMPASEILRNNASLNALRRAKLNTKG